MSRYLPLIAFCAIGGLVSCANAEVESTSEEISRVNGLQQSTVGCNNTLFAQSQLCAKLEMTDGLVIEFTDFGYHSLGPTATTVNLTRVGELRPVVSQCAVSGAPQAAETVAGKAEIHKSGMFGALLTPPIDDAAEAVNRRREVYAALAAWPKCPEFWAFQTPGMRVRYCAATLEAPEARPSADPSCAP